MPVKIVKKPVVIPAPMQSAAFEGKIRVGDCEVCSTLDFSDERGVIKFLVHIRKAGMLYKLIKATDGVLLLESVLGTQFASKVNKNIATNYMMVKCYHKQTKPSPAAMEIVQRLVAKVTAEGTEDTIVEIGGVPPTIPTSSLPDPLPASYGRVKVTRRAK